MATIVNNVINEINTLRKDIDHLKRLETDVNDVVTGTGTANTIAKFTDTDVIGNSGITDNGTAITMSEDVNISSDKNLNFTGTAGGVADLGIYYKGSSGTLRGALMFPGSSKVALCNRAGNGVVEIRANTGTGGSAGEVTVVTVEDDKVTIGQDTTFSENVTVQGNTTLGDASGDTITLTGTTTANADVTLNEDVTLGSASGDVVTINGTTTANSDVTLNEDVTIGSEVADNLTINSNITEQTYSKRATYVKAVSDNSATSVFTITTTDEASADGGGYACFVKALILHSSTAPSSSGTTAAKSFSATFCRAQVAAGTGANSAVSEIIESASAAQNPATRDITTVTMTVSETSEYVQDIQFTVDGTGSGTPVVLTVIAQVELVWYGFLTPPTMAVA